MFEKRVYVDRRRQLSSFVGDGLIILPGNEESSMNYRDNLYRFRQDSTFLYFFGIDRPGLIGMIDVDNDTEVIYGNDLTTEQMIWTGYQEPLELLSERIGISKVCKKEDAESLIKSAASQKRTTHFIPPYRSDQALYLAFALGIPVGQVPARASEKLIRGIVSQRSYKSPIEIEEMTRAVNTTADMQVAAMTLATEGMTEAEVAGKIHGIAIADGGDLSFPSILTQHGEILHNGYSQAKLKHGSLVLCDCGAETANHYAGDLTRTFPVGNKFNDVQRNIYDVVLTAHRGAVSELKPGKLFRDIHLYACEKLTEGLQALGLMKGDISESVAAGAHALFFPCGLGHMLGLDTHDMENLGENYVGYNDQIKQSTQFGLKSLRLGRPLEEHFVVTVEPGLYFNPDLIDAWAAEKRFTSFINYDMLKDYRQLGGIRVEEDFLITAQGSQLLGKSMATTTAEIEELRQR